MPDCQAERLAGELCGAGAGCYDKKRKQARMEEQENIRQYIQSLQTKQQK